MNDRQDNISTNDFSIEYSVKKKEPKSFIEDKKEANVSMSKETPKILSYFDTFLSELTKPKLTKEETYSTPRLSKYEAINSGSILAEIISRSITGTVLSYPTIGDHPIMDMCRIIMDPKKILPFVVRRELIPDVVEQIDINSMYMNCIPFQEVLAFMRQNDVNFNKVNQAAMLTEELLEDIDEDEGVVEEGLSDEEEEEEEEDDSEEL